MSELLLYQVISCFFLVAGIVFFIVLFFITAPYGRHKKEGWGPGINAAMGWLIMEAPASLLFAFYFFISDRPLNAAYVAFFIIWQSHYLHRAFVYPFSVRNGTDMPVSILLSGFLFNLFNTYVQARWLFHLAGEQAYPSSWLADPRFIAGAMLFYAGYFINKQSDGILRGLRKPGETGYKIPYGGMYRFVSCPNYFGEIIEWTGWAILTWSFGGMAFAVWTVCNLAPRAYAHHLWYKKKFPLYPPERKSLIPYIF
jgi:3-oxo-5-alpha-steroid 4-dehydrogenase 1